MKYPKNLFNIKRQSLIFLAAAPLAFALLHAGTAFGGLDPQKAISQYVHDIWTTDHGLPQNSIQTIIQTDDGYLWFGTQEGLVRFDGMRFVTFDKSRIKELKDNYIISLYEDSGGGLWVGTRGGGLSHLKDGKFSTYTTEQGLASNFVQSICEDQEENLWIGTSGGLNRLKNGNFSAYTTREGLSNDLVQSVCADNEGGLWIGTGGAGLNYLKDGKFIAYTTNEGLSNNFVRSLLIDKDGSLWIGTENGLNNLRDGKFMVYTIKEGLSNNVIYSIHKDSEGSLWIGTYGGGLSRLRDGGITTFTEKEGLSNDIVYSLYEDHEGSLWIGTFGGGLNRLKDGRITTFTEKEGLSGNLVRSIYEDREGIIWIGTDGNGLNRFEKGRFKSYTTKEGLSNNFVKALLMDREGTLWIGTDNGVSRFKDGKFRIYTTKEGLSNNFVLSMFESFDGSLWIGTRGGLNCLKDGKFFSYTTEQGLSHNIVRVIMSDRAGNLWIGTDNGLNQMKDGKFKAYTTNDGLANDFIYSIYEDRAGILWIGTRGGLNRFTDGKFTTYTSREGMFDEVVFQILEDSKGCLWMSCNKGIFWVSKKELNDFAEGKLSSIKCVSYGKADGMKSRECNGGLQPAGWKTRDGRLWFPTIKGVVVINPEVGVMINDQPPPVLIEQVLGDEEAINIKPGQEAVLSPGTRRIEFHYTGLSFLIPERVKFKYRLEGFDNNWIEGGTRRVAYYTNVSPGHYRFRVIACNNDGIWNEEGASFRFYLRPRFYQTVWFYIVCGLGLVLSGAGAYRFRVRQLKKHEEELEKQVKERTTELEAANKELQREITERKRAEEDLKSKQAHLDQLFESAQEAIVVLDNNHRIIRINGEFTRMFGYKPEEVVGQLIDDVVSSKEFREEAASYTKQLSEGERISFESVRRRKDETLFHVSVIGAPIRVGGKLVGYYAIYRDITERKRAEENVRRRAAQASLLYEVGQRLSSKLELKGLLSEIATSIQEMFDYYNVVLLLVDEKGERLKLEAIAGGEVNTVPKDSSILVGKGMTGRAVASGEIQVSGDVSKNPYYIRIADERTKSELSVPIKSGEKVIGVLDIQSDEFNAFDETDVASMETLCTQIAIAMENARLYEQAQREISERKRAEEIAKTALNEREVLLKEIHHRVKNNMQIISSLLRLQSARFKDEKVVDMFKASQSRIRSMALIHESLYQSKDLARINFSDYIEKLAVHLFSAYRAETSAVRLKLEVKDIRININKAIPCGLIISELVTNSLKHGFPEGKGGEIGIRMTMDDDEKYTLVVRDTGVGFPKGLDFRKTESLGMQLISSLVGQLGGTIELKRDNGTEFIIRF